MDTSENCESKILKASSKADLLIEQILDTAAFVEDALDRRGDLIVRGDDGSWGDAVYTSIYIISEIVLNEWYPPSYM
jgi:phosphoheptose isomerase